MIVLLHFFNLVSCLLSLAGISFIDGIVGTGISIWILISAVGIFKRKL